MEFRCMHCMLWLISHSIIFSRASQVAQWVKNPPAMQEVLGRGGGNPLEEGLATHSSILAWRNPWIEEPSGLQFIGSKRVRHN